MCFASMGQAPDDGEQGETQPRHGGIGADLVQPGQYSGQRLIVRSAEGAGVFGGEQNFGQVGSGRFGEKQQIDIRIAMTVAAAAKAARTGT